MEKTDIRGHDECWPFTGSVDQHGYGRVSNRRGRSGSPEKAYRVAYEMLHGPIPTGKSVLHKCDNPSCVNPNHLEIGDQRKNMQDAADRGRLNPVSQLNLRPGHLGFCGARPRNNNGIESARR
jgi:hypothetical protein